MKHTLRFITTISICLLFGFEALAQEPKATGQTDAAPQSEENGEGDQKVFLGHTTQLKKEVSGAVSTVTGDELAKSPVPNLSMALAGRLQGLFSQETYSEPSRTNTALYARGISSIRANQPIVVIDGMVVSHNTIETFDYISAEEVESVTLLKDAASLAIYGIQGADGVLVITTRRGTKGPMKIGIMVDQTFEQMGTKPTFYNSWDYASMRNQAAANDGLGANYYFTDDQIAGFRAGSDYYSNNNWRDMFLKDVSSMQRVGVNLSGGTDKMRYFSNVNMLHQGNYYKGLDQEDYNSKNQSLWVNFRSNVDMKINKYLTSSLRLAGNVKREKTPGTYFLGDVYQTLFPIPSTVYGPVTPDGGVVVTDKIQGTPYGLLNRSGFNNYTVTNIYGQFALNLDMSFLAEGLSMGGSFAYHTNSVNGLGPWQTYSKWIRTGDYNALDFTQYGTDTDSPLVYAKSSGMYSQITYQGNLSYERTFNRDHHLHAMAYINYQDFNMAGVTLPSRRVVSGAEVTYNYADRYLVKFNAGYSGSEQYARDQRFVFTPAASAAWVVTGEPFMQSVKWLDLLKIRASYGKTATERSGLARYAYSDNTRVNFGGLIPSLSYIVTENLTGSPGIAPEISKKLDVGADIGIFNGFSLTFDIFDDRMDNMVISSSGEVPTYQGVPQYNLPSTNTGKFQNQGYEIGLAYTKAVNSELEFSLGGSMLYAKNKVIVGGETIKNTDYAFRYWQNGYSYGQEFGYIVNYDNGNGYYNSAEEIANDGLAYQIGTPRVGDLRYKDLNDDGIINEKDKAPIGTGSVPRYTYSVTGQVRYKAFDFSFMLQGVSKYSSVYSGAGVYEYDYDGVFGSLHSNAWTAERYASGEKITYPALATQKNSNHESSDFFLYDRSYLRLRYVELGYTLPVKWSSAISADKMRLSVSAHNLFTWDKMKSDDFGPEGSYASVPAYRFYNIKLSMNF